MQQNLRHDYRGPVLFAPSRRMQDPVRLTPRKLEEERLSCPFCTSPEQSDIVETYRKCVCDYFPDWLIRVIPNKYPVVDRDAVFPGVHEVIIEGPEHNPAGLSTDLQTDIWGAYVERCRALSQVVGVEQIIWIKNVGRGAGASLSHPHSQIQALPFVMPDAQKMFVDRQCVICDEIEHAERYNLVTDQYGHFMAFCPWASRVPYEVCITPASHGSRESFIEYNHYAQQMIASLMVSQINRIQTCYNSLVNKADLAYNVMLLTAPPCSTKPFHWCLRIMPRIKPLAALEVSGGVYVNAVYPEDAAAQIRAASSLSSG